ncbi:site-2 protease family protein [Halorussus gelatinilyticus]|uniref:Zinc metalloprotease n=1 Tax=Halorussus gelatinilyticus TaxID=2937524 RepID=A0A8U0ILA5_9EURY|nr:site-2 protease family protein [Halorussus gelatinilyticus]UPW00819.1 site-2 protease family protein [Halorussus gelatinilyticus]
MKGYRVLSVWGIPIRINVSLVVVLPILAWLIGSGEQIDLYTQIINGFPIVALDPAALRAGNTPWFIGIAAAVGLFVSVTLHELGHAWAARRYDIEVESITLWLLGGLANLKAMPREWQQELWIALAGPAASVLVAAVCYGVVLALPASVPAVTFVVGWLVVTNVVLTVFNLLPAFPMDGGRVLRALLARSRPYAEATRTAARIGSLFAIGFAVLGVLSFSPMLLILALFVYGAANGESRMVALETLLDGVTAEDVMDPDAEVVSAETPLSELGERMLADRRTAYTVADESGSIVGVVSLDRLRQGRRREAATVGDVMVETFPTVAPDAPMFEVVGLMNEARASAALVEADGEVVGILTSADLATTLAVRREAETPTGPRVAM